MTVQDVDEQYRDENKEQCSSCSLDSNNRVEAVLLSGPYGEVVAVGHRDTADIG
ncbi:hypothetical protein [Paenibacillus alvei]|uniref:hypothetical protein n=1 Tax=Paenibacillus alvei TaxID=44250 RepID=UPI000411BA20|nr:hypothetical protein [Paenibacillus alvei]